MILLDATNETVEVVTTTTSAIDVAVTWADLTASAFTAGSQETAITTATTTTVAAAPAASTQRQIKLITLVNTGSVPNVVTVRKTVAGTPTRLYQVTLQAGQQAGYVDGVGFAKRSAGGVALQETVDRDAPSAAFARSFTKAATTMEAAGVLFLAGVTTGTPGVWSAGTPGLNGRATDGTTVADAGCIPIPNAASGSNYLTGVNVAAGGQGAFFLADVLWANSGLVVTTTTAQTLTPVALPARDGAGSTNGVDVQAALLVNTATTNAAAITNTTITYTNQDGTAGRTGTMPSFPATATAGTLVPFMLQAGDTGVRSVQSVTLGTSYVSGNVSLVLYRTLASVPQLVANAGGAFPAPGAAPLRVRLANGVTLLPMWLPVSTTGVVIQGVINVETL